jgi:ATP-dependent Clp protease protease subunit
MDLKYCKNISDNEYELLLHGIVGEEINGREVASEIHYLNSIGATKITERINTIGGTITEAFSIVSANIASKCEIHTMNEGVADSAGSFILASGDPGKRGAYDFATVMIHNPTYNGKSLEEIEDESLRNELIMMRDSIVTILVNNSGMDRKTIIDKMAEETRMNAKEAKSFGLIDFVKPSVKKPKITENMSLVDIMNICTNYSKDNTINNSKSDTMKKVLSYLNLNEDATESSALEAVKGIQSKADEAKNLVKDKDKEIKVKDGEITQLKNQATEKDTEITNLKAEIDGYKTREIENAVQGAITSGKFAEDSKDDLTTQAKTMGVENFNKMVGMINAPKADAASQIENKGKKPEDKGAEAEEKKLADEYQNLADKEPLELKRIKDEEPARFEKMFNAWDKH